MADTFPHPTDLDAPVWSEGGRVHNWKSHVSEKLRAIWPSFTREQKEAIWESAEETAMCEEWD